MEKDFALDTVLDLTKWEKLQETIAATTHLALLLVDYRGVPVTPHSQVKPFCHLARTHPKLGKYCEKCDARGGLEAARSYQPFIYRCHFDIIDMAIPITIEGRYVGAIMAGEIMLTQGQHELEQVLSLPDVPAVTAFKIEHQELLDAYPRIPLADLKQTAALLQELSEYIVSEAIKKDYYVTAYKQALHFTKHATLAPTTPLHSQQLTQSNPTYTAKNKLLQPVIDAIFANKEQHLSLQTLAPLVNLSPNYLSRLLRKEFGEPFSQVYTQLKIDWAQELLQTTTLSINEISDALGFLEPSYFIRSFKKITKTTPLKWRQLQTDNPNKKIITPQE